MIAYFSRTGTRRNLDACHAAGWHMLLSPKGMMGPLEPRWEGRRALDSGAWWSFRNNQPFDEAAYDAALQKFGLGSNWIALPDIVAGGLESLELSLRWLEMLRRRRALNDSMFMLVVQDGMEAHHVRPLIGLKLGIFLGGSTAWKIDTMRQWGQLARERGAYYHVGRVNSARRIHACEAAGADSFDGTSATCFAVTVRPLELARQQIDIERYLGRIAP